jgi:hypothetical protein
MRSTEQNLHPLQYGVGLSLTVSIYCNVHVVQIFAAVWSLSSGVGGCPELADAGICRKFGAISKAGIMVLLTWLIEFSFFTVISCKIHKWWKVTKYFLFQSMSREMNLTVHSGYTYKKGIRGVGLSRGRFRICGKREWVLHIKIHGQFQTSFANKGSHTACINPQIHACCPCVLS